MYRETLRDLMDWSYQYLTVPFGISAAIPAALIATYITINHQMYYKRLKVERKILYIIPIFKITSKGLSRVPLTLNLFFLHFMYFFVIFDQLGVFLNLGDYFNLTINYFNQQYNLSSLVLWWLPLQIYLPFFIYYELGVGKKNRNNQKLFIRDALYVKMFLGYYIFWSGLYFYNQYWVIMENFFKE